jgi:hypothetical protein
MHPSNSTRREIDSDRGEQLVRPGLHLPDFTTLPGPNGENVLVPRYMVPLAEIQIEGVRKTYEMPLDQAKNGVSPYM